MHWLLINLILNFLQIKCFISQKINCLLVLLQILQVLCFSRRSDALGLAQLVPGGLHGLLPALHAQVVDHHIGLYGDKADDQQNVDDVC